MASCGWTPTVANTVAGVPAGEVDVVGRLVGVAPDGDSFSTPASAAAATCSSATATSRCRWQWSSIQRIGDQKLSLIVRNAGPRTTTNSAGRMQNTSGKTIFTGIFIACSSARARRLSRSSSACTAQRVGEREAVAVGLADGEDDVAEVGDVGAVEQPVERLVARQADLHVLHHPAELLGEDPVPARAARAMALSNPRPGLDADGDLVDHVGQLQLDAGLPLAGRPRRAWRRGGGTRRRGP